MKWNKTNKRLLYRSLTKRSRDAGRVGASCIYVPLTVRVGVKLYTTAKERDRCFELQKRACRHQLAPKVGDKFYVTVIVAEAWESPSLQVRRMYGYLSQIAKVRGAAIPAKKEIELGKALRKIGIKHSDLHQYNVGYIDKKLVCIDFDSCSCYRIKSKVK